VAQGGHGQIQLAVQVGEWPPALEAKPLGLEKRFQRVLATQVVATTLKANFPAVLVAVAEIR
jgi:hypothetical protein